jgi:hypothetical protein
METKTIIKKQMKCTLVMHDAFRNETTTIAKFAFLGDAILAMNMFKDNTKHISHLSYEIQTRF